LLNSVPLGVATWTFLLLAPAPPVVVSVSELDEASYLRSRGLFAGVSLEGSTLRPDNEANEKLYRKRLPAKDIVLHRAVLPPASAAQLLAVLNKKSPRNKSHVG
jgi:lipid-binding SYLF domain-containing protein